MPVGYVLVGNTGGDVKHNNATLTLNVVTISETTKLLLASGVPNVEANGAEIGRELKRMDLDSKGG